MKIVILDGHAVNPGDLNWDLLNQFGEVTVYERTPVDQVAARIADADIVLTNKSPITEAILEANILKLQARYPDGFDSKRSINREV